MKYILIMFLLTKTSNGFNKTTGTLGYKTSEKYDYVNNTQYSKNAALSSREPLEKIGYWFALKDNVSQTFEHSNSSESRLTNTSSFARVLTKRQTSIFTQTDITGAITVELNNLAPLIGSPKYFFCTLTVYEDLENMAFPNNSKMEISFNLGKTKNYVKERSCIYNITEWNHCSDTNIPETYYCGCYGREADTQRRASNWFHYYIYWYVPVVERSFHEQQLSCKVQFYEDDKDSMKIDERSKSIEVIQLREASEDDDVDYQCEGNNITLDSNYPVPITEKYRGYPEGLTVTWSKLHSEQQTCDGVYSSSATFTQLATYMIGNNMSFSVAQQFNQRTRLKFAENGFPELVIDQTTVADRGCYLVSLTTKLMANRTTAAIGIPQNVPDGTLFRDPHAFSFARHPGGNASLEIVGQIINEGDMLVTCRLIGTNGDVGEPPVNITILSDDLCIKLGSDDEVDTHDITNSRYCSRKGTLANWIRTSDYFKILSCRIEGPSSKCGTSKIAIVVLTQDHLTPFKIAVIGNVETGKLLIQTLVIICTALYMTRMLIKQFRAASQHRLHKFTNARLVNLKLMGYNEEEIQAALGISYTFDPVTKRYMRLSHQIQSIKK